MPETFVEGSYFQNQDKYITDWKYVSCEGIHPVLYVRLAGGGPLPLLSGSRFFRSCFLNKYWSKSPRQWAAPWAASLLPFFFNACLSVCAPSTESGRIHKLLGVAAFGVGIGMSWRQTYFFHFFSTISVLFFFFKQEAYSFI